MTDTIKVYLGVMAPLSLVPESEMDRLMGVNFMGTLFCMQAEIEAMKKQEPKINPWNSKRQPERGSIINMISLASSVVGPFASQYAASKHAVNAITKGAGTLNLNSANRGVRQTYVL
jgi:NAD(P)-dependent dehydrogenase (short-subunit alcohol dehydrogenase family)